LSVVNALSLDKFLKKCDILLSDEEFDSYFIKMDKDQDGVINYREFQNNVL
jgi:Ca2+-binding EF-hand superfamily protein